MKLNKLFLFIPIIAVICAVFGFYSGAGDNHGTSAVFGTTDMHNAPQIGPGYIGGSDVAGTWTNGQNVLQGRFNGEGAGYVRNDTAWEYFMGGDIDGTGNEQTRVDKYNVNTNTWTTAAPMTVALGYFGSGRLRDSIYTIGGFAGSGGAFTSTVTTVQKYDINANAWTTKAPLPEVIGWAAGAGYQDSILYSVGGLNVGGSNAFANVYVYNVNTNTWRAGTPLPIPRVGGAMAIVGDTIVYIGGNSGYFGTPTNVVYKGLISQANRSNITWSTGTSYPGTNRWRFKAMPWGCKGLILTAGGPTGFTIGPGETYTYSPGADAWTIQPNLPTPTNTAQVASVKYTTGVWKLVVASGLILTSPYSIPNTQIFTDTLCPVPPLPGFTCGTTAYVPITGGTPGPVGDDATLTVPIGFTFNYVGVPYTQASICTNGFVVMGPSTESSFSNNLCSTTASQLNLLAPFWDDLNTTNGGTITYTTLGSSPNRIFVVQYDNVAYFSGTGTVTVQVRLYEGTDIIDFIYGTATANASATGHIGINKAPGGSGNIIDVTPGANCSATTFSTTTCTNVPYALVSGTIYRFSNSGIPVGINHNGINAPNVYTLSQNYPNPFNPSTKISFGLPKSGIVKLVVYDVLGREVKTLVNEFRQANTYDVSFDASNFASGIYFYTIKANDFTETKKMLLVK